MALRHVNIIDLVDAIEARLKLYATSLRQIDHSQVTDHRGLADLVATALRLPAGIVLMGPADYETRGPVAPGLPVRTLNLGLLIVAEYSADFDAGADELWTAYDEVNQAFLPSTSHSEVIRYPVSLLGAQGGSGIDIVPAGWTPLQQAAENRAAGILNILAIDRAKKR